MTYVFTTSDNLQIPINVEKRRGMHNITLRPKIKPPYEIHLSMPFFTPVSAALSFLEQKRGWIEKIYDAAPQKTKIQIGDTINFCGKYIILSYDENRRSNFYSENDMLLIIGGSPEMFEFRVREFIKKEFMAELKKLIKTVPDEFRPGRITLRDTTSSWGSCSSTRTISFSWRLAFAPHDIMRYVVMHELAHLKHMDHSPDFWAQVGELYGDGVGRAKLWLSKNGQELHKYF